MVRRQLLWVSVAAALAGCGSATPPDTVDSLMANPKHLSELRDQCKIERAKLGDEECNRVAQATDRLFLGDGKTPYTPPKESPKF